MGVFPNRRVGVNTLVSLVVLALSFAAAPARAQCIERTTLDPSQSYPGTDATVNKMVVWDADGPGPAPELLVVAGAIEYVGPTGARGVVAFDGERFLPLGNGLHMETTNSRTNVSTLVIHNNQLFAFGQFTRSGSTVLAGAARFDGTQWQPIPSPGAAASSGGAAISWNGSLYASGWVSLPGGQVRGGIYRWNGSGWDLLTEEGSAPSCFATFQGDLLAGNFRTSGGASGVFRYNGTTWTQMGQTLSSGYGVVSLHVHNNELYAGGWFEIPGDSNARSIVKWNASTSQWSIVGNDVVFGVYDLTTFNNRLVLGGTFYQAGSQSNAQRGIAFWNGTNWNDSPIGLAQTSNGLNDGQVQCLAQFQGNLYVGGFFSQIGGVWSPNIARWNGSTWSALGRGLSGKFFPGINALAPYQGQIAAGGFFDAADGTRVRNLAFWNGTAWSPLGGGVVNSSATIYDPRVYALYAEGTDLYVGGLFTGGVGGFFSQGITKWNGSAFENVGSAGVNFSVNAITRYHGDLIVAGNLFGGSGDTQRIRRLTAGEFENLGNGLSDTVNTFASIGALVVHNDELIAGGRFNASGALPLANIAAWNGTSWRSLGAGFNSDVSELVVWNGQLIALGSFNASGATPLPRGIAIWNGTAWQALGTPPSTPSTIFVHNAELYAALVSTNQQRLARWTGSSWQVLNPSLGAPNFINAAISDGNSILLAADFRNAAGSPIASLTRWQCACPADLAGAGDEPDGAVTIDDLIAFLVSFEAGSLPADLDDGTRTFTPDGAVTIEDLVYFLVRFEGGC